MNEGLNIACQIISGLSIISNLYLLFIYCSCSVEAIKSYKHFFLLTALQDLLFSGCIIVLTPIAVASDYAFIFVTTGPLSRHIIGIILVQLFAAIFILSLLLVTNSFIYRYLQVCRPRLFELYRSSNSALILLIVNVAVISNWVGVVYVVYSPNALLIKQLSEEVKTWTGVELPGIASIGISRKYLMENSISMCLVGEVVMLTLILSFISAYFAMKIRSTLKKVTISKSLQNMQRKMFALLLLQTSSPMLFLQTPFLVVYTFTFLGLKIPILVTYLNSLLLSLFPLINPIIIIAFLNDYRTYTLTKLRLRGSKAQQPILSFLVSDVKISPTMQTFT